MESHVKNISDFNENNDINFEFAYGLARREYTHAELLNMLKDGSIPEKQIAALKFDYVSDESDAVVLLENLTGCDGKIREQVALTINKFLSKDKHVREIFSEISAEKLAAATVDINGNICRLAIDSAIILKDYEKFAKVYTKLITDYTLSALDELDKFIFRDKKYVINKQLFKLYWSLEPLTYFSGYVDKVTLKDIVERSSKQSEYTIREQIAKLIKISGGYEQLAEKLKQDENYYVREVFKSS